MGYEPYELSHVDGQGVSPAAGLPLGLGLVGLALGAKKPEGVVGSMNASETT